MGMQEVSPDAVLRFAAESANATEAHPLKLGNVEVWIGHRGPWDGELLFFPESSQWDRAAFESALNDYLTPRWDELCAALHAQVEESPAPWQTEYSGDLIGG